MILLQRIFLFCGMLITPAIAQEGNFVYDEHGKKDPFSPLVSPSGALIDSVADVSVADLTLEGIVSDPEGNNVAVVNGKIVKKADRIGPYEVHAVTADQVKLLKDNQEFVLQLKKGGN